MVFSQSELLKMGWEELTAQCISACAQGDFERADHIRYNDAPAKIAHTPPFQRAEAEAEALPYLSKMTQAIDMFFPE